MPLDNSCRPDTLLRIGESWQSDMVLWIFVTLTVAPRKKTETKKHTCINSLGISVICSFWQYHSCWFGCVWVHQKPWRLHANLHNMKPFSLALQFLPAYQWASPSYKLHPTTMAQNIQGIPRLKIFPILGLHTYKSGITFNSSHLKWGHDHRKRFT